LGKASRNYAGAYFERAVGGDAEAVASDVGESSGDVNAGAMAISNGGSLVEMAPIAAATEITAISTDAASPLSLHGHRGHHAVALDSGDALDSYFAQLDS